VGGVFVMANWTFPALTEVEFPLLLSTTVALIEADVTLLNHEDGTEAVHVA